MASTWVRQLPDILPGSPVLCMQLEIAVFGITHASACSVSYGTTCGISSKLETESGESQGANRSCLLLLEPNRDRNRTESEEAWQEVFAKEAIFVALQVILPFFFFKRSSRWGRRWYCAIIVVEKGKWERGRDKRRPVLFMSEVDAYTNVANVLWNVFVVAYILCRPVKVKSCTPFAKFITSKSSYVSKYSVKLLPNLW